MSQCPICNTAIWVGQRYCPTCDNYLPLAEEEDHFCLQCGIKVAPQQKICHKCKATLPEIAETPSTAPARAGVFPPKIQGILIGTVLAIVALLLVFLFKTSPGPPQLMVTPPPQAASEQTSATAPIPQTAETAPSAPTVPVAPEPAVSAAPEIPSPPQATPSAASLPMYFVNVPGLALRDGPTMSAPQIATLKFQDQVELLDTSGGWARVQDLRRNIVGWSAMRYLQPVVADAPRTVPQHPPGPKEKDPISSDPTKDM
jgi:hypothetical protein